MKNNILWITRTAVLTALLIVMQTVTSAFGNTLVTGSIVNLILIISVMTCGLSTGLTVAVVSPMCAKLLGIGPLWSLIPFIIAGNIILVIIWYFIGNSKIWKKNFSYIIALVIAALSKFLILYLGIVQIAIPILLNLPKPQATIISNMFSIPQLFTALLGGILAIIALPFLKRSVKTYQ